MTTTPIFTDNFLSHCLLDFKLTSVTNIRGITLMIKFLIEEFESGKIKAMKEEEFKPRFITTFFGDILGFNYENSVKWHLKNEKKSVVDATKADSTLGYFFVDSAKDSVRAVIEIKDGNTLLDAKQSRSGNQTPVEQAFSYAHKSGGNCKWVIVSNFIETRFYSSKDSSKYQVFFLKELQNELKLKELLLLFHKDRFINESEDSQTEKLLEYSKTIELKNDKPLHIIDKLHYSLKRFEGFGFVDPNFIANIYPFNVLEERVWQFDSGRLFTINPEIYALLKEINFDENNLTLSNKLCEEIRKDIVVEAEEKLNWIFNFLKSCQIRHLTAIKDYKEIETRNKNVLGFSIRIIFGYTEGVDGITKKINREESITCDCIRCNFRNLDFKNLLNKLKSSFGDENCNTSEYAYGNYLTATNNFKTAFSIYKSIEKDKKGRQEKGIEYFLAKKNIKLLHNLILDYNLLDSKKIMNEVKSVDLDKVIYNELEFEVDSEVKKYLIEVKEDSLIYEIQDDIIELQEEVEELRTMYSNGGKRTMGNNVAHQLIHKYELMYCHLNANYIIYDVFTRYKKLAERFFRSLVSSSHIPEYGLSLFNDFLLTEAILQVQPSSLQEILKDETHLKVNPDCIESLLKKVVNYTSSFYEDGFFNEPFENPLMEEQLNNHRFREKVTGIFANMFTVLSKLEITKEQFDSCRKPILYFLKFEKELAWYDLKQFANFLLIKGNLFEHSDLIDILKISIDKDRYGNIKYEGLIESTSIAIKKYFPEYKLDNQKLVNTAILKCNSDSATQCEYYHLIDLVNICNSECVNIMFSEFEKYLDRKFDERLYTLLLRECNYDYNRKDYFKKYTESANKRSLQYTYRFGKQKLTDVVFIGYIFTCYEIKVNFKQPEFKLLNDLNDFESWILNPVDYNYNKFDAFWLIDLVETHLLERLKGNQSIAIAIEKKLSEEFHPVLARLKYTLFNLNQ